VRLRDLIGQDQATAALRRAVSGGHVPHAYLFEGPRGVGKRTAARALALALDCEREPGEGCGACETCRRIEAGVHPDVPVLAPDGPQIVIDEIKAVVALAQSRPHEAPARVIIVDDADAMNVNAANSLLKTLEEPAPRNHLVLCTSAPERLPSTIRSRVQRVRFHALAPAALLAIAERHGLERARAEVAIALADGSAARMLAAATADDQTAAAWQAVGRLREAATARGASVIFDAAQELAGDKDGKQELPQLVALLCRVYRDALVIAAGAPELALFAGEAAPLAALGTERLGRALGALVETDAALAANVNPIIAVERLLLTLRRCQGSPA
jgi:DNA polymerase-3 subunit delta'